MKNKIFLNVAKEDGIKYGCEIDDKNITVDSAFELFEYFKEKYEEVEIVFTKTNPDVKMVESIDKLR